MVSKPDSCTSETNCQFICEEFVAVDGASEEAIDLTKATDATVVRRRLAAKSKIVYSNDAQYDPDNDANSAGGSTEEFTTDASFPTSITSGGKFGVSVIMMVCALFVAMIQ